MKLLIEIFPVVLFFVAYKFSDIYVATGVLIVACAVQIALLRILGMVVESSHKITLVLVVLFGGATLLLHDEQFIKWKPTVINWLFAAAFAISHWVGERPILARMLAGQVDLSMVLLRQLSWAWVGFFVVMGGVNLYVIHHYDTDTWVNFKLFGLLGMTLIFMVLQSIWIMVKVKQHPEGG
ncbi:MAG: septation protein A [Mariprofundales bacterium]|nr:septation protein A [Mariprofundales bacterium]